MELKALLFASFRLSTEKRDRLFFFLLAMAMSISLLGKLPFDLKSVDATRHVCIEIHENTGDAVNRVVNGKKR